MSPVTQKSNSNNGALRRTAVGFNGGQVLALRLQDSQLTELRQALNSAKTSMWLEVQTADGAALIKLPEVAYLQVESEEHRVGF